MCVFAHIFGDFRRNKHPGKLHHRGDCETCQGVAEALVVVDSGTLHDYLAQGFQDNGLPVFRSADIAVGVLGKYIRNRLKYRTGQKPSSFKEIAGD